MSTQRGNTARQRAQKHRNRTVFKNDLHDKSDRMKAINAMHVGDVCVRCKDIIDWKIKYKKYKPLSQPKSCVKCAQKRVKKAYHVICAECVRALKVCAKCLEAKEIVVAPPDEREQVKLDAEMRALLQSLPERKRRTFLRFMAKQQEEQDGGSKKRKGKSGDSGEKGKGEVIEQEVEGGDEQGTVQVKDMKERKEELMFKLNELKLQCADDNDSNDDEDEFDDSEFDDDVEEEI